MPKEIRQPEVGEPVIFGDKRGNTHWALVTKVWNNSPDRTSRINLAYVDNGIQHRTSVEYRDNLDQPGDHYRFEIDSEQDIDTYLEAKAAKAVKEQSKATKKGKKSKKK